jgi:hypothetical protein
MRQFYFQIVHVSSRPGSESFEYGFVTLLPYYRGSPRVRPLHVTVTYLNRHNRDGSRHGRAWRTVPGGRGGLSYSDQLQGNHVTNVKFQSVPVSIFKKT